MTDQGIHGAINTAMVSSASVLTLGWLTFTEWMTIGGFIIAALTLVVNYWHKRVMQRLRKEEIALLKERKQD